MRFSFFRNRYAFECIEAMRFPPGGAGNVFRGALGLALRELACTAECEQAGHYKTCRYALAFEPRQCPGDGPSGLADPPRPFVLRAAHLDGTSYKCGQTFTADAHLFSANAAPPELFAQAFGRAFPARAVMTAATPLDIEGNAFTEWFENAVLLTPRGTQINRLRVAFITPTELKSGGELVGTPVFPVLFARVRDRLRMLSARYATALDLDFDAMTQRAEGIRLVSHQVVWERVDRRSSKTGQTHPMGGFRGEACFEGDLSEFAPLLEAARWCGVGRQTVWGKGEIEVRY